MGLFGGDPCIDLKSGEWRKRALINVTWVVYYAEDRIMIHHAWAVLISWFCVSDILIDCFLKVLTAQVRE